MPSSLTEIPANQKELVARAELAAIGVFGVTRLGLLGTQRSGPAWQARAAFCMALTECGVIWHVIGLALGRSHSGPRANVARVRKLMATDKELRARVDQVVGIVRDWVRARDQGAAA